jgi:phosphotransferase system HPr (HPr) family protein
VAALDVQPNTPPEETLAAARALMGPAGYATTLVLTDIFGATPCNVAQKLVDGVNSRLIAGVNVPMLLRAVSYRHEPLDALVARALAGGTQGVMQVANHRAAEPDSKKFMIKTTTTISNKLGLHARASAKLTKLAGSFPCEVWMSRGERRVNAKSIMGVMMLAAGIGAEVDARDQRRARAGGHGCAAGADRRQVRRGRVTFSVHGLAVARGIAIGRAVLVASSRVDVAHYFIEARSGGGRDRPRARRPQRRGRRIAPPAAASAHAAGRAA